MKISRTAIVLAGMTVSAPALADNDGSAGCIGAGLGIVVSTCEIDVGNGKIGTDELANGSVTEGKLEAGLKNKINGKADKSYVDSENDAQDVDIAKKADKDYVDTQNHTQDDRLDDVENKNEEQDDRLDRHKKAIKANYAWDAHQQKQINHQGKAIAYNYAWDWMQQKQLWNHGERIGSLEQVTEQHSQAISAHSALLSQHSSRLDQHAKGIAIAMSLPDAWIESNKRFAIAGNIGGFGDETAIGAAAIFRIDETWSVNGKLGADTSFDEFGWTVGARASW